MATLKSGWPELRSVVNALVAAETAGTAGADTVDTEALIDDVLSADAAGRSKMATDYFNAATVLLKIADGAFAADTATRALFGDGIWTAAKLGASSVTTAKLGTEVRGEAQALSGPGAVNLTTPTTRVTTTGTNDALTLADGTVAGQRKTIFHAVDGGSFRLTAGGSLHLGDSIATITSTAAKDWVLLEWSVSDTVWNVIGHGGSGVTFA